MDCKFINWDF